MANNKVKYNLKNAHYAMLQVSDEGVVSFGTRLPYLVQFRFLWMQTASRRISMLTVQHTM